jgi:hypothetical protein
MRRKRKHVIKPIPVAEQEEDRGAPDGAADEVEHEVPASRREVDIERDVIGPWRGGDQDVESAATAGWDVHPDDVESGGPGRLGSDPSPDDLE